MKGNLDGDQGKKLDESVVSGLKDMIDKEIRWIDETDANTPIEDFEEHSKNFRDTMQREMESAVPPTNEDPMSDSNVDDGPTIQEVD